MDERLEDLLARLEREREEGDRLYNTALTTLDRALQVTPPAPDPPPAYDETQITPINVTWDILPDGPPACDRSWRGRLGGFIWRLVGPPLDQQKRFNAALVDHLNRNVPVYRESAAATATLVAMVREHIDGTIVFQHRLVQFLQTVTLYVDTKDRATAGHAHVLNAAIGALTNDWLKRWETLAARANAAEQRFSARVESLDDLRASISLASQTSLTLKRELERLIAGSQAQVPQAPAAGPPSPAGAQPDLESFKYVGFEDAFRGPSSEIRARLAEYLPHFADRSDILDIGCGRGEFLDLLREHGVSGRGLDLNHEMVEVSRARGLDVAEGDALEYVRALDDASLGGIFAAQVVEHLEPAYLMRLIETAFHKIRPDGLIVLETINPACWVAFFESYIRDLTHVRALHPETLQYLVRASGFQQVAIEYKSPIPEPERLQPVAVPNSESASTLADLAWTFNDNVAKLNARMFTYQDYAIVARK
jgi:SAM-dependent methyltransferase